MSILERLRLLLGISPDDTNIVTDDIWAAFFAGIQHAEGNAVEVHTSAFTDEQLGELLADDLIYFWHRGEDGVAILYSDKDRLARFDTAVLQQLELADMVTAPIQPWWGA